MITTQKGFSLVELMMAIGISSMIFYAMFAAMRVGDRQTETSDLRMTIQDSAREGLYRMVQEIRESAPDRVTIGAGCNSITFNVPNPNNPINVATYAVNWPGDQITYSRNASNQIIRSNATTGQTTIVANDVTAVMFTTDTTSPFACSTGPAGNISAVSVVESVQRNMKNGRSVPATPLQIAGQAGIRNS